tara:strand:+ start:24844 stop:25038 length:195 start_codon:yes stop_codon:yes gene_type:complete
MKIRLVAICTGLILTLSMGVSIFGSITGALDESAEASAKYTRTLSDSENSNYAKSAFLFVCPFH